MLPTVITLAAATLLLLALPAGAQPRSEVSTRLELLAGRASLERSGSEADAKELDAGNFAAELVAYLTQEILSDAGEEYRDSPIPSRLNDRWWQRTDALAVSRVQMGKRSRFGEHCLLVIDRLFDSTKPSMPASLTSRGGSRAASVFPFLARSAATFFLLRDVFSSVAGERPSVLSLEPRLSTSKAEARIVIRW